MASIVTHDSKGKSILACLTGHCNESPSNDQQQRNASIMMNITPNHHHDHSNENEMKETQMLLASEMNKLSVRERSTVMDDVHCVGEGLVETPEMVQQSLEAFEVAIQHHQQMTKNKNQIYELAYQQNPSYVEDPSFRLPFLRANMHNVDRSVSQMMNFLQYKAQYFGTERLTRDITLDDLSEEERGLMMSGGFYHIQDGRDRSGRVIVYLFNHMLGRCRAETLIRVAYYVWVQVLIPIPEAQMKGVNVIYYDMANPNIDPFPSQSLNFAMTTMKCCVSLPLRHSAVHVCLKNGMTGNLDLNDSLIGFSLKILKQHDIVRTSLLFGSDLELQYQLRSKGIPVDATFPVDSEGSFRQEDVLNKWLYNHFREDERMIMAEGQELPPVDQQPQAHQADNVQDRVGGVRLQVVGESARMAVENEGGGWIDNLLLAQQQQQLQQQQQKQLQQLQLQVLLYQQQQLLQQKLQPTNRDVLLGKGMRIQLHPGNVHFRAFLAQHSDKYDHARRKEKPLFCTNMVLLLQSQGIRFLHQQSPGIWTHSDMQEASKKVGDFFRTVRKKKRM